MKAIDSTASLKGFHWLWVPALYLLTRLLLLFYSPHSIYRFEELYQGYLGIEFLEKHLQSRIWDYQIDPYTGGSLVVGVLAALSFKIFGTTLFALKLVPLLFSFLTLLATIAFLQRFFGKAAAIAGGLLMTFPAPALTSLSVSALGSHPESQLFAMGMIWAFYEIFFRGKSPKLSWFFLGLLSSLGLWFSLLNGVILLNLLLVLLGMRPKPKEEFQFIYWGMGGAALGAAPWLAYNFPTGFSTLAYFRDFLSQEKFEGLRPFLTSWSLEVVRLFLIEIPASLSLFLNHFFWDRIFSSFYCLIVLSFLISLFQRMLPDYLQDSEEKPFEPNVHQRLRFFVISPVIFLGVLSFLSLTMAWHGEMLPYRFRYFATFFFYLCLLGAILGTRGGKFGWAFLGGMVLMGAIGFAALLRPENAGRLMRVPGYSIEPVRRLWSSNLLPHSVWVHKDWKELAADENLFLKAVHDPTFWYEFEADDHQSEIKALSPRMKYYFILNMASSMAFDTEFSQIKIPSWFDSNEQDIFYFGFARGLDWDSLMENPQSINSYYTSLSDRGQLWFVFVFSRFGFVWNPQTYQYELTAENVKSFVSQIKPRDEKWIYRGIGAAFLRHFPNLYPLQRYGDKILKTIPPEFQKEFWWGLGWNLRGRRGGNDKKWFEKQIRNLPPETQSYLREGFAAYQNQWYENSPVAS